MTEHPDHRALRESLGAFALGHLSEVEAGTLAAHVEGCAACRADLAVVAPAAAALAGARRPPVPTVQPPADLGRRVQEHVGREARRSASGRTARTALASALAGAAVAAAVLVGLDLDTPPARRTVALEAVPVVETAGIDASADLVAHGWGVEVKLTASGLRPGARYEVSVLAADGSEFPAGAFVGVDGEMLCNLNAAVLREQAVGFVVRDVAGASVLESTFPA